MQPTIFSESILVLQWVIFILLIVNYLIAHKRDIKTHQRLVISLFIVETIFNLYMLSRVVPIFNVEFVPLIIIHASLGFCAYVLILYTILYMTEKLPESLRFVPTEKRIWLMRITTIVWMFFTVSGTIVYFTLYL